MAHATPITSHALSVAFGVLALGVLVDLDRAPYDPEAEKYHYLSRAALAIESCLENTTIQAIQSLVRAISSGHTLTLTLQSFGL